MSTRTVPRRRLAVHIGDVRHDIAVAPDLPIGVSLQGIGLGATNSTIIALDAQGRRIDLSAQPEYALADGSIITMVDLSLTPATPHGHTTRVPAGGHRSTRHRIAWWLAALAATLAGVLATLPVLDAKGSSLPAGFRFVGGGILVALSLIATIRGMDLDAAAEIRAREAGLHTLDPGLLAVPPLLAASGAMLLTPAVSVAQWDLMLFAALGAAAVVSALGAVTRSSSVSGHASALLAAILTTAATFMGLTLLLDWPGTIAAAALVGAVPPVMRALPTWCVRVPDAQLIDIAGNSDMAWTVRGRLPGGDEPVRNRTVAAMVTAGELQLDTGTVALSALPVALLPWIAATTPSHGIEFWAMIALTFFVVVALAYQPRTARSALARWVPRVGAGLVLLGTAGVVAARLDVWAGVVAITVFVIGLLATVAIYPLGRGYRSLGMSRITDGIERVAVVLALPAGLLAAGLLDILRAATS